MAVLDGLAVLLALLTVSTFITGGFRAEPARPARLHDVRVAPGRVGAAGRRGTPPLAPLALDARAGPPRPGGLAARPGDASDLAGRRHDAGRRAAARSTGGACHRVSRRAPAHPRRRGGSGEPAGALRCRLVPGDCHARLRIHAQPSRSAAEPGLLSGVPDAHGLALAAARQAGRLERDRGVDPRLRVGDALPVSTGARVDGRGAGRDSRGPARCLSIRRVLQRTVYGGRVPAGAGRRVVARPSRRALGRLRLGIPRRTHAAQRLPARGAACASGRRRRSGGTAGCSRQPAAGSACRTAWSWRRRRGSACSSTPRMSTT